MDKSEICELVKQQKKIIDTAAARCIFNPPFYPIDPNNTKTQTLILIAEMTDAEITSIVSLANAIHAGLENEQ